MMSVWVSILGTYRCIASGRLVAVSDRGVLQRYLVGLSQWSGMPAAV